MLLLFVWMLPHICLSFTIRKGSCDEDVRGMPNFDQSGYLGQWYEYSNVFEIFQDLPFGGNCVRATYTKEGDSIGVLNEYVSSVTGYGNIKGSARVANPSDPKKRGELVVSFFGSGGDSSTPNYSVIKTDYKSYSVVYSCSNFLWLFKKESLWLLTRDQIPSNATVQAATSVMESNNLPVGKLKRTEQTGCEDLPGSST